MPDEEELDDDPEIEETDDEDPEADGQDDDDEDLDDDDEDEDDDEDPEDEDGEGEGEEGEGEEAEGEEAAPVPYTDHRAKKGDTVYYRTMHGNGAVVHIPAEVTKTHRVKKGEPQLLDLALEVRGVATTRERVPCGDPEKIAAFEPGTGGARTAQMNTWQLTR